MSCPIQPIKYNRLQSEPQEFLSLAQFLCYHLKFMPSLATMRAVTFLLFISQHLWLSLLQTSLFCLPPASSLCTEQSQAIVNVCFSGRWPVPMDLHVLMRPTGLHSCHLTSYSFALSPAITCSFHLYTFWRLLCCQIGTLLVIQPLGKAITQNLFNKSNISERTLYPWRLFPKFPSWRSWYFIYNHLLKITSFTFTLLNLKTKE